MSAPSLLRGLCSGLARLALRSLPRRFREAHADDMLELFREHLDDALERGP